MPEILDRDLREVVETIWSVTLGLDLLDAAGSIPPPPEETMCGCIHITGTWTGLVTVSMSERLARRAAAAMFEQAPDELTIDELHDALGEITNMTGGSIKGLLPAPSQLSLPSVVSGTGLSLSTPGGVLVREAAFQVSGSQIRVSVTESPQQLVSKALSA